MSVFVQAPPVYNVYATGPNGVQVIVPPAPLFKVYTIGENAFRLCITETILIGPAGPQGEQGPQGEPGTGGGGDGSWGSITGDITDQTDLIEYIDNAIDTATDGAVQKVVATIGDGALTSLTVNDNLGTIDKIAVIRDAATEQQVSCDIDYDTNTTTFIFFIAPALNAYKVVILG